MPLVPASVSLQTTPGRRPMGAISSAKDGAATMCRITPSVSVSTTADSWSASCWNSVDISWRALSSSVAMRCRRSSRACASSERRSRGRSGCSRYSSRQRRQDRATTSLPPSSKPLRTTSKTRSACRPVVARRLLEIMFFPRLDESIPGIVPELRPECTPVYTKAPRLRRVPFSLPSADRYTGHRARYLLTRPEPPTTHQETDPCPHAPRP